MEREILFRAKLKDWKINSEHNRWVEGFYLKRKKTTYCFTEDYEKNPVNTLHFIAEERMNGLELPLHEIDPETLSEATGLSDRHKTRIFENDIVEFVSSPKHSNKYLIWWNKEMSLIDAVPLDNISFNGNDYFNSYYPNFRYETFCVMMQDSWGDFSDVKVIGNIIDNPELIELDCNKIRSKINEYR